MTNQSKSTPSTESCERILRRSAWAFLRAERSGGAEASDAALRALLRALPSPVPSAQFAARVMTAVPARALAPAARRVRDLAPRHRWLVAAAALCAALASAYLLPLAVLALGQVEWGAFAAAGGAAFGTLVSAVHGLAVFLRAAVSLAHALWLFLASPQVLLTLVFAASVLGLCLRFLTELIHSPGDPAHASF